MKGNDLERLKQHIRRAGDLLRQTRTTTTDEGDSASLIYMGNHHDSVPRDLVMDTFLESGEIHTWMLMKIHISSPHLPSPMPSQNNLIDLLKVSRPVVSRHLQVLRAMRWITLCDEIRGTDGRIRGHVYAQHDTPLPLQDTLELDPDYLAFLERPCNGDVLKRLRIIKAAVLKQIHNDIGNGMELHQSPGRLYQIAKSLGHISENESNSHHVKNFYMAEAHVKNFNMANNHVKNFDMDKNTENQDVCSSSYINNKNINIKTTTTTTTSLAESEFQFPSCLSHGELKQFALKLLERIDPAKRQFALDWMADRQKAT